MRELNSMQWTGAELLLFFIFPLNSVTCCLSLFIKLIIAQNSKLPAVMDSDMFPDFAYQPGESYLSLILLALTVGLSGSVYLCVLRYICTGCCQPVVVRPEDDNMSGVV